MTDATPPLHGKTGADGDEDLVFDDFAFVDADPAAAIAPPAADPAGDPAEGEITTSTPRRAPRRGRKTVGEDAASAEPAEGPAPIASAEAAPAAPAEEPAGGATPAPFPPRETRPAGSTASPWLLATVALALLTSLLSLGGLIAVGRTLAHAEADRASASAERDALARVPALIAHLDDASGRLAAASARLGAASPSGPPATIAEVRREIDLLKLALAARQPQGLDALNATTREGFSVMATKLDRMQARTGGAAKAARGDDGD